MMYEYSEESIPLNVTLLPNIELKPDNLPTQHPYVPRICEQRGHFLIWYGSPENNQDILEDCLEAKSEQQWINCDDKNKVDLAVALVYPYDNEVILGTVKYAGYVKKRTKSERTKLLRGVWNDIVTMFGDRKIICPSGAYFDYIHLCINQKRAPHEPYHRRLMNSNGFVKDGEYWIRDANLLVKPTTIN